MQVHVCMKIGEGYYRLENKGEEALKWFNKAEEVIAPSNDYLIHLFKAKTLDRLKRFQEAIASYETSLIAYQNEEESEDQLLGNIYFRLGWA